MKTKKQQIDKKELFIDKEYSKWKKQKQVPERKLPILFTGSEKNIREEIEKRKVSSKLNCSNCHWFRCDVSWCIAKEMKLIIIPDSCDEFEIKRVPEKRRMIIDIVCPKCNTHLKVLKLEDGSVIVGRSL